MSREGRGLACEILFGLTCLGIAVHLLAPLLITGEKTVIHDALYWEYPLFQSLAKSVLHGELPLWNPYSHAGEPSYPLIVHLHMLDPIALTVIAVGHFFTGDISLLFNWTRFLQCVFLLFGTYLCLRPLTRFTLVRLILLYVLCFSSYFLCSFRQHAFLFMCLWTPYVVLCLLRLVRDGDNRWGVWLCLACALGINQQSYYLSGVWVFMLFFFAGVWLFQRSWLDRLLVRANLPRASAAAGICLLMQLPNLALLVEQNEILIPARMASPDYETLKPYGGAVRFEGRAEDRPQTSPVLPYSFIRFSGTHASGWEFLQMIARDANLYVIPSGLNFGRPSEAFIYFGLVPWMAALIGIFFSPSPVRRLWIFIALGFALLMLGPTGGLHRLLYVFYPPLWLVRNTHVFVLFFDLAFLHLVTLGLDFLAAEAKGRSA